MKYEYFITPTELAELEAGLRSDPDVQIIDTNDHKWILFPYRKKERLWICWPVPHDFEVVLGAMLPNRSQSQPTFMLTDRRYQLEIIEATKLKSIIIVFPQFR